MSVKIPEVGKNAAFLWSVLPYVGVTGNYLESGVVTEFRPPVVKTTRLVGIPFDGTNTGANPDLRVIRFTAVVPEGPAEVRGDGIWLNNFTLNYTATWKIKSTTNEIVNIGFYTANYLANASLSRVPLLLNNETGPSIYRVNTSKKRKGKFTFTDISRINVVVDRHVMVYLKIHCEAPISRTYPDLQLYTPFPYKTPEGVLVATEELADQWRDRVVLAPTRKYISLTETMINFLNDTSVILDFSPPTIVPQVSKLLQASPLDTITYPTPVSSFLNPHPGRFGVYLLNSETQLRAAGESNGKYYSLPLVTVSNTPSLAGKNFYARITTTVTVSISSNNDSDIDMEVGTNAGVSYKRYPGRGAGSNIGFLATGGTGTFTCTLEAPQDADQVCVLIKIIPRIKLSNIALNTVRFNRIVVSYVITS